MMLQTTTPIVEGHPIKEYKGIVSAQSIIGANVLKDFMAGMRDFFGGRSKAYEKVYRQAKEDALRELAEEAVKLGGNAIVGVRLISSRPVLAACLWLPHPEQLWLSDHKTFQKNNA